MPYLVVRHKVEDYARWEPFFDEHGATRAANWSKGGQLLRNADDPNELVVIFEWDDLANARRFAESEDLRQKMQQAGVADQPDI